MSPGAQRNVLRPVAIALAVVCASVMGLVATAGSSAADHRDPTGAIELSVSDRATAFDRPDELWAVVDQGRPGGTVSRQLTLANHGTQPVVVELRAQPAAVAPNGSWVPGEKAPNSLPAEWVDVDPKRVLTFPPGASTAVDVTFRIPKDARPGERLGAIGVFVNGSVSPVASVGTFLAVGPPMATVGAFSISPPSAVWGADGQAMVEVVVKNLESRALPLAAVAKFIGADSRIEYPTSRLAYGDFVVPAGGSIPIQLPVSFEFPNGDGLDAKVTVTAVGVTKSAAAKLTWPGLDSGAERPGSGVPLGIIALIVALLLLLAGGVGVLLARRRPPHEPQTSLGSSALPPTPAVGETGPSVANVGLDGLLVTGASSRGRGDLAIRVADEIDMGLNRPEVDLSDNDHSQASHDDSAAAPTEACSSSANADCPR